MSAFKIVSLKENEEIFKTIRRHWLTYLFSIFITFILICLPFLFIVPLFQWGKWGILLFFLIILVAIVFGLRTFVLWYYNIFVITNKRVIDIDQKSFFSRVVWDSSLDRIQDVTYSKKGLIQTLFNYGNIQIIPTGSTTKVEIINIHNPQKVQEMIHSFQDEVIDDAGRKNNALSLLDENLANLLDEEIVEIFDAVKAGIGEKRFKKIINKFVTRDNKEET